MIVVVRVQEALLFHFKDGVAGERLVTDPAVFAQVVEAAKAAAHNRSVGGNAAIMAKRFAAVLTGGSVLLGGVVGADLAALLGPGVSLASPQAPTDEVHLILEYAAGEVYAGVTAPRANRFIISADRSNGALAPMEAFHKAVVAAPPSLLVISGLHMVDAARDGDTQYRSRRFKEVEEVVAATKASVPSTPIHVELASVSDKAHMALIAESTFGVANSAGLSPRLCATPPSHSSVCVRVGVQA